MKLYSAIPAICIGLATLLPTRLTSAQQQVLPCGGCPIPIEQAMREWQARNALFSEGRSKWPDAQACDGSGQTRKAPPYPPDGFYGDEMCDPRRASELVKALADQVLGAMNQMQPGIDSYTGEPLPSVNYPAFRDINGMGEILDKGPDYATIGNDVRTEIGAIAADINVENYCTQFASLLNQIRRLSHLQVVSNVEDTMDVNDEGSGLSGLITTGTGAAGCIIDNPDWNPANGCSCCPTCEQAIGNLAAALAGAMYPHSAQFNEIGQQIMLAYQPGTCGPQVEGGCEYCWGETYGVRSFQATLRASTSRIHGQGKVYISATESEPADGSLVFHPPIEPDGQLREYGSLNTPTQWYRPMVGNGTGGNGDLPPPGTWEWRGLEQAIILKPQFDTNQDSVVNAGDIGCSTCQIGEVRAMLDGVQVLIDLGAGEYGGRGYLIIRGDSVVGAGNEIWENGQAGSGARGLGSALRIVPRLLEANGAEVKRQTVHQAHHLRQIRLWDFGLVDIVGGNDVPGDNGYDGTYHIKFYRGEFADFTLYAEDGRDFWAPTATAELVKQVTVSHTMAAVPVVGHQHLVTGELSVSEYEGDQLALRRVTRFQENALITDWEVEVEDEANGDVMIPRGNLPNDDQWVVPVEWSLLHTEPGGSPVRREVVKNGWDAALGARTVERAVGPDATLRWHHDKTWYKQFDWGEERTKHVLDPEGAELTTTWEYYDSKANDGAAYTRLKRVVEPSGRWEAYAYDAAGRIQTITSQFLDRDDTEDNRVVAYAYHTGLVLLTQPIELGQVTDTEPEFIVERVESLDGHEIARSYSIYWSHSSGNNNNPRQEESEIRCASLGAPADLKLFLEAAVADPVGSPHMVTHRTAWSPKADRLLAGRPHAELSDDGTATLYSYEIDGVGDWRTYTVSGPVGPDPSPACPVGIDPHPVDGTMTVTLRQAPAWATVKSETFDLQGTVNPFLQYNTGILIAKSEATDFDNTGRPTKTVYLDGTYTESVYGCCGLESRTDREGNVTIFEYDALRRVVSETGNPGTAAEQTLEYIYDHMGRLRQTSLKTSPTASIPRGSTRTWDAAGRLVLEVTPLGHATTHAEAIDPVTGWTVRTTTLPVPGPGGTSPTRITTSYPDGSVRETGGTAGNPVRYEYGVEFDADPLVNAHVRFAKQIMLGDSGEETEWVKSYTDPLGRQYKTVFADGSSSRSYYNKLGELVRTVDPDGVSTRYLSGWNFASDEFDDLNPLPGVAADWRGRWQLTVVDMDQDGQIAFGGTDRVTRTRTEVAKKVVGGETVDVHRTTTTIWTTGGDDDATLDIAVRESSVDGLRSWSTSLGVSSTSVTAYDRPNRRRTVTSTGPDGAGQVQTYEHGRLVSTATFFGDASPHTEAVYGYDSFGRNHTITDTRTTPGTADDRTTTYTFDNDDRVVSVQAPPHASGAAAQVTTMTYDGLGRVIQRELPDGGLVHTEYYPTGAVKRTYGARQYPTEYTYDSQGRLKTLTTWKDFDEANGVGNSGSAVTTWNYDPQRGWLTSKAYADGKGPSYQYWPSGRLKRRTWSLPRGITTDYTYTAAGEPEGIDYSDATPDVTYAYDRRGRLQSVVDGVGTRVFTYNDASRQLQEDFTAGSLDAVRIDNAFDGLFRRESNTVRVGGVARNQIGFGYEPASSRLRSVTKDAVHIAEYGYAPASNLIQTQTYKHDGGGVVSTLAVGTRSYDGLDRLTSLDWDSAAGPDESFAYTLNSANQRTRIDLADGSHWIYTYDGLGQVISGGRHFHDGTPVIGQQFEYGFDEIGNRTATSAGRDGQGLPVRPVSYSSNSLNQYTQRGVADAVDIMGYAPAASTVTVGGQAAYRFGEFYHRLVSFSNLLAARFERVTVSVQPGTGEFRWVFLPKTPEQFTYDADGNLLSDGRWTYEWDAENRLVAMQTGPLMPSLLPKRRLEFVYDYLHRRSLKRVYYPQPVDGFGAGAVELSVQDAGSASLTGGGAGAEEPEPEEPPVVWALLSTTKFVWDGWLLVAELNGSDAVVRTHAWGPDLSGSLGGAGGIGGLAFTTQGSAGPTRHALHDGNGNVVSLRDVNGDVAAAYEYGPFGETLLSAGAYAGENPHRFSGKYTDSESGLVYYGYRYYNAATGRWLNRDLLLEQGGPNVYCASANAPTTTLDPLGLYPVVYIGDEAAIIRWVPTFNIAQYANAATRAEFGRGFDSDIAIQFGARYAEWLVVLTGLWETANSDPPTSIAARDGPRSWGSKRHRGWLYFTPSITCDCGKLRKSKGAGDGPFVARSGSDPGYTRYVRFGNDFDSEAHPTLRGNVELRQRTDSCVTFVAENAARVTGLGGLVGGVMTFGSPPYISSRISYRMCCNGDASVKFESTIFPANRQYLGGKSMGTYLPTQADFLNFTFSNGGEVATMQENSSWHTTLNPI